MSEELKPKAWLLLRRDGSVVGATTHQPDAIARMIDNVHTAIPLYERHTPDVQAAIDAVLEKAKRYIESAYPTTPNGDDKYQLGRYDALQDAAVLAESLIGTNPLADLQAQLSQAQARVAELEGGVKP